MNLAKGRSISEYGFWTRASLGFLAMILIVTPPNAKLAAQVQPAPQGPKPQQSDQKQGQAEDDDEPDRRIFSQANTTFVPASRELTRPLMRARRSIEENDLPRAAELIGEFLIQAPEEDYLVIGRSKKNNVSVSLRELAETMLSELPASALKSYRVRYGIPARHQLEKAISQLDDSAVSEVAKRYFHTEAGQVATMLIGHRELQRGNPISAAASFYKLVRSEEARSRFDPELSILLATSLSMAGEKELAREQLQEFRKLTKTREIQFDGQRVPLFEVDADPIAWLAGLIGESQLKRNPIVNEWLVEGGNAQRNALSKSGLPFRDPRWRVRLGAPTSTQPRAPSSSQRTTVSIPAQIPMSIGNTITLSTSNETLGVDFTTGKRKWAYPPRLNNEPQIGSTNFFTPNAQVSKASDGARLFLIDSPNAASNIANRFQVTSTPKQSSLVSLELEAQGRLGWRVGKSSPAENTNPEVEAANDSLASISNIHFLGPPLPLGNELFVIADLDQTVQLIVLDRNTGEFKWKQHLAVKESTNRYQRYQPPHALSPSYDNGVLVCPTGTGALIAIDLSTRLFLWGHQYHQARTAASTMNWSDCRLVISKGKIYYGAIESRRLHIFDLESGEPLGSVDARLGQGYLAAVFEESAIIVGSEAVESYSINAKLNWKLKLSEFGTPSGRGFLADGHYVLPTNDRFVLKIRLSDGKVVDQVETSSILGNLVSYRGAILSHSANELSCYVTDVTAEAEIEKGLAELGSLEKLPPNIQKMRAQLCARAGDWEGAIEALEYASQTDAEALDSHQVSTMISFMLLDRKNDLTPLIEKFWPLLSQQDQRELQSSLIEYWIGTGRHDRAAKELIAWAKTQNENGEFSAANASDADQDQFYLEKRISEFDAGTGRIRNASIDRLNVRIAKMTWFRSVLNRVMQVDPSIKTLIQNEIKQRLKETDDVVEQFEYLERYPSDAVPAQLRRQLLAKLIATQDFIRAKRLLLSLIGYDLASRLRTCTPETPASVGEEEFALWVDFQVAQNQTSNVFQVMTLARQGLLKIDSLEVNETNDRLAKLAATLENAKADPPLRSFLQTRFRDTNQVTARVSSTSTLTGLMLPVAILDQADSPLDGYTIGAWNTEHALEFFDPLGKSIRKFAVPKFGSTSTREMPFIRHNDSMLVLQRGKTLVGINLQNVWKSNANPILWDVTINRPLSKLPPPNSPELTSEFLIDVPDRSSEKAAVAKVSANGICFAETGLLHCINPIDGRLKWTRPLSTKRPVLLGDDEWVVVVDTTTQTAEVIDLESARFVKSINLPTAFRNVWDSYELRATTLGLLKSDEIAEFEKLQGELGHSKSQSKSDAPNEGEVQPQLPEDIRPTKVVVAPAAQTRVALCGYDFRSEAFVWTKLLDRESKATRISGRRIAVLTESGNIDILNRLTGKRLNEIPVRWADDEQKQIRHFGSVQLGSADLFAFQTGSATASSIAGSNYVSLRRVNSYEVFLSGSMMLVDRKTNAAIWRERIRLTGASLAPFTPQDSPVILFHRRVQSSSTSRRKLAQSHHVLGINRWNGQELFRNLRPAVSIQFRAATTIDPEAGEMKLRLTVRDLNLKLEQIGGLPPQPVAWIDRNNALIEVDSPSVESNNENVLAQQFDKLKKRIAESDRRRREKANREKAALEAEFGIEIEK